MQDSALIPRNGKIELATVEVLSRDVTDDLTAIKVFLDGYARKSAHTQRSYEKECFRFLLWLRATRPSSHALLPQAAVQDVNDYLAFLAEPRAFSAEFLSANGWKHQPFRKALGPESVKHCLAVLHMLFAAMREMRSTGNEPYCKFNPVNLAHQGEGVSGEDDEIEEALTEKEWDAVQSAIEALPRDKPRDLKHYHRARWVMQLLYRAFLRREEAAALTMGSFQASPEGWNISLVGKGKKKAKIIATEKLMGELRVYRASLGLPPVPSPGESAPAIQAVTGKAKGVTAQAIYLICKTIFTQAADLVEASDTVAAARLRQASPHWMRHTGVSHSMESGIDPRYVQAQARHSSLNVTARYDHKRRQAWRKAFEEI
ncbi:tyrosine-type recombinase/integrase [Hydrogenophaga defluvii]|uniref:Tyrosine-type recombinase/integrase n=1 Tax=Hydrogenophaga defluvii TaxID=249410 RepID=A0ABW2SGS2_9BURK